MAKTLNKVFLIGRAGRDPETRLLPSGLPVVSFSIATEDGFNDNKKVSWHNIKAFNKTADAISSYVKKGDLVHVEGRIDYQEWETKGGDKKTKTEIIVDNISFLGKSETKGDGNPKSKAKEKLPDEILFFDGETESNYVPPKDVLETTTDDDLPF
jgi:single-strand DNA-binding protein